MEISRCGHDLSDYDISAPPVIANIKIEEFIIEAVIVTTKTGNTYVFDRKTGKSLLILIIKMQKNQIYQIIYCTTTT